MKNVLILTGSVRPGNVSEKVAETVAAHLAKRDGVETSIVKVGDLKLPFFNADLPPSAPEFEASDENVIAWTKQVADADAVVLAMPEYNHSVSPVQKNALDWIYKEWADKPVAPVAYGWYAGENVLSSMEKPFKNLKVRLAPATGLTFMKDISPTGEVLDTDSVKTRLDTTFDHLLV